jgi:pSer/pThr/pTyr-binding forkhead associated (FHA) protein/DNA-binding CsgD family transcriptional regulator
MMADDAAPVVALLHVVRGPGAPTAFPLRRRAYRLGRAVDCDVVLPDPSISRYHARLVPEGAGFRVEDLESRHGTIVDGERVATAEVPSGTLLHLGNVTLRLLVAEPDATTADWLDRVLNDGGVTGVSAEVLDTLQIAVVLVSSGGRHVLWANRSARQILNRAEGLSVGPRGLHVADGVAAQRLRHALASETDRGGGALHVPRPSGRPLALVTSPLAAGSTPAGPIHAVFITDPDAEIEAPAAFLARLYGLTPAESDVAEELLAGRAPDEVAAQLGISIHTARTHVKRILSKTETRRQSELIRLLLLGPAQVREGRSRSG